MNDTGDAQGKPRALLLKVCQAGVGSCAGHVVLAYLRASWGALCNAHCAGRCGLIRGGQLFSTGVRLQWAVDR